MFSSVFLKETRMTPIHLHHYFEQAHVQPWQEIPIAQVDHYQWRMIYALGEYPWHQHDERDDCLWVLAGCLGVDLPDGVVQVRAGQLLVVPRGVQHRTFSRDGAYVLLFEPMV